MSPGREGGEIQNPISKKGLFERKQRYLAALKSRLSSVGERALFSLGGFVPGSLGKTFPAKERKISK